MNFFNHYERVTNANLLPTFYILSVTSKDLNCDNVFKYLNASGINCNVIKNKWEKENTCDINFYNKNDVNEIMWANLKNRYKLDTGYIYINKYYDNSYKKVFDDTIINYLNNKI